MKKSMAMNQGKTTSIDLCKCLVKQDMNNSIIYREFQTKHDFEHHANNVEKVDFLERINLFNKMISDMGGHHIGLFDKMIENLQLHDFLSNMIRSTNTSISLKGLEIVENFTKYYVQCCISKFTENENEAQQSAEDEQPEIDVLTIGSTRICLIRLLANVISISIETHGNTNAYIEFSTLTLLHLLFHSIMPVPLYSSDIFKSENIDMLNKKEKYKDIREIDPINKPQLEIIDPYYLTIRLDFVFSVWPYVKASLDSTWTCIKKIVYKVLACILKNNLQIYDLTQNKKLKKEFSLLLKSLLETNDSESKKNGLHILGSF